MKTTSGTSCCGNLNPNDCLLNFDLNAISSRNNNCTVKDYLLKRNSIIYYIYIMGAVVPLNISFQHYYSLFYGLNRLGETKLANYYNIFKVYSQKAPLSYTFLDVLNDLKNPTSGTGCIEKSFGSKMFHSLNPCEPIIDSVVIKKLRSCSNTASYFNGIPKNINSIKQAVDLHNALKACYFNFLIPQAKSVNYFAEFDKEFPAAAHISDVKKIDFFLWAM